MANRYAQLNDEIDNAEERALRWQNRALRAEKKIAAVREVLLQSHISAYDLAADIETAIGVKP